MNENLKGKRKMIVAHDPWMAEKLGSDQHLLSKSGCVIAHASKLLAYTEKVKAANFKLMAASPKLLRACQKALDEFRDPNRGGPADRRPLSRYSARPYMTPGSGQRTHSNGYQQFGQGPGGQVT
jgi:hypothetical protein